MEVLTHKMMTQSFSELDAVALKKMKAGLQRADNALEGFQQSVAVEDSSVHLELVAYLHAGATAPGSSRRLLSQAEGGWDVRARSGSGGDLVRTLLRSCH